MVKESNLRMIARMVLFIAWAFSLALIFIVARALKLPKHQALIPVFHAGCCRIFGMSVIYCGEINRTPPSLYVSNHLSYLDIFILGNLPAYFIAKSEVGSWPVLGYFAKLQNTLFFERRSLRAKQQIAVMREHLASGKSLTLFPEGTSTGGDLVLPFKSSLFDAADLSSIEQQGSKVPRVAIQPVTIAFTRYDGELMDQTTRDYYAWYLEGDPFGSHFIKMAKTKKIEVKVMFHPVCYLDDFESRKQCADFCQQAVAEQLAEFNSGE
jgi:1-acyl-sn-glycerol-3-phosphate acyltransferase